MTGQRVRVRSIPLRPAMLAGAWAGFVPGLFIGAIIGTLASFGAGAALEWMRELSFTTGIQQQLLPFGDRSGLLQTLEDGWPVVIPVAALAVGLLSAVFGALTGALIAASFGSILRGVEIDVDAAPVPAAKAVAEAAPDAATTRGEEYRPLISDS